MRKHLHHPRLGKLELTLQTLLLPGSNLQLILYTADPGTSSAEALTRL
ncbi:MmyB family transcriptional regulator [Saccharopolyspora tripterygii]